MSLARPLPKVYRVGGAVRDRLLGLSFTDVDWVVVGATPDWLLQQGYVQVGKDFPVFLHPFSKAEYALARNERKSGQGYHGFVCDFSPDISLEEDLARRDLTINAMAEDEHGQLIDPYRGQQDLHDHILRHVSPAFAEDPLRVLRVARFAARFHHLGFRIAAETLSLMQSLSLSGELATLPAERVWQETERALAGPDPDQYFQVLRDCHALHALFPELDQLFGVPQRADYHPEVDTGVHTLMSLQQATALTSEARIRFAVLVHDLGKALTPDDVLPSHRGHEARGLPLIRQLGQRLRVPRAWLELALLVGEFHLECHRAVELRADTLLRKLEALDIWRRPERFGEFLLACEADARGRTGLEHLHYWQADYWRAAAAASQIDIAALTAQGLQGQAMAAAIRQQRLTQLTSFRAEWQSQHDLSR